MPIFSDFVSSPRVRYDWGGGVMTGLFLSGVWTSVIVTLLYSLTRFKLLLKYLLWNKAGTRGKKAIISVDSKM